MALRLAEQRRGGGLGLGVELLLKLVLDGGLRLDVVMIFSGVLQQSLQLRVGDVALGGRARRGGLRRVVRPLDGSRISPVGSSSSPVGRVS